MCAAIFRELCSSHLQTNGICFEGEIRDQVYYFISGWIRRSWWCLCVCLNKPEHLHSVQICTETIPCNEPSELGSEHCQWPYFHWCWFTFDAIIISSFTSQKKKTFILVIVFVSTFPLRFCCFFFFNESGSFTIAIQMRYWQFNDCSFMSRSMRYVTKRPYFTWIIKIGFSLIFTCSANLPEISLIAIVRRPNQIIVFPHRLQLRSCHFRCWTIHGIRFWIHQNIIWSNWICGIFFFRNFQTFIMCAKYISRQLSDAFHTVDLNFWCVVWMPPPPPPVNKRSALRMRPSNFLRGVWMCHSKIYTIWKIVLNWIS